MNRILIVHVSDLHFGSELFWRGKGSKKLRIVVPGLHGHDVGACEDLLEAVTKLQLQLTPSVTVLAVTGDLTVDGDDSQFSLALSYLHSRIQMSWQKSVGMGGIVDVVQVIPGNHDHLDGNLLRGVVRPQPASGIYEFFGAPQPAPWFLHTAIDVGPLRLQVGGIDTCGAGIAQFGAQGSVDQAALRALASKIASADQDAPGQKRIRILLMHHCLSVPAGLNGAAHAVDAASVQAVQAYCGATQTRFVLTGHIHAPQLPAVSPAPFGTPIRCGTTLQHGRHGKWGNTFLAHVIDDGSPPTWTTHVFQRHPQRAFQAVASVYQSEA